MWKLSQTRTLLVVALLDWERRCSARPAGMSRLLVVVAVEQNLSGLRSVPGRGQGRRCSGRCAAGCLRIGRSWWMSARGTWKVKVGKVC